MNDNRKISDDGKKVATGVAFVIELVFEAFTGIISGIAGIFFQLVGWLIGIGIIVVLVIVGWNFIKDADFSGVSETLQSGIESVTEGYTVEGWTSEVDSKTIVPTEEDIEKARQAHEEEAAEHEERTSEPYPFSFRPPTEREVTIVTFRDKRIKEFRGISPKPIPLQKYVIIRYGWTNSISDVEVVEKPDPLLEEPQ